MTASFEFHSGGAYHPSPYGEWIVQLGSGGALALAHRFRDLVQDLGTSSLTAEEQQALWAVIHEADIPGLLPATRMLVPDEIQYTFVMRDKERAWQSIVPINDARKNEKLVTLVATLGELIARYTGQEPVLR
jgi:hypothetical protein